MNKILLPLLAAVISLGLTLPGHAAEAKAQLAELVTKVRAKLKEGKKAEKDFADELKAFDAILEEHKAEKTDEVAEVAFMRAALYAQIFENDEKAAELLEKVKTDFPGTAPAKRADQAQASLVAQKESKKIQRTLVEGAPFPEFEETGLDGQPLSLAKFKGKVVLIDFWATWCGPCIAELPNVQKAYQKHHDKGFDIIGISLDQDKEKLTSFIKEKQMPWPQYFDGKGWQNKLAGKYGVTSIPATYLLDKEGKIIAKGLRGDALEKAVENALK